jgi:hypothetical protein
VSRFGDYDGEEDYNNSAALWWANVERQFAGRKGRDLLWELIAALEAMPVKQLVHGVLCDGQNVCAVGAVMVARRVRAGEARDAALAALAIECGCGHGSATHPDRGACTVCKTAYEVMVAERGPERAWNSCHGYEPQGDAWETAQAAQQAGLPRLAAYRIEYHNDEEASEYLTSEQRYDETLAWARRELARLEAHPLKRPPRRERQARATNRPEAPSVSDQLAWNA